MGHCLAKEIHSLSQLTRSEQFVSRHHLRLTFKPVFEHRGLKRYFDKHLMVKVSLQLASDQSVEKWYLTEEEFHEVAQLLTREVSSTGKRASDRECELCNDGSIERRYPGCQV